MVQHESVGELARAWITQHRYVDSALQVASISVFAAVAIIGASTAAYGAWWLVRLLNPGNFLRFVRRPVPGFKRGKIAGQEFETDVTLAESDAMGATNRAVRELIARLDALELTVQELRGPSGL